MILRPLFGIQFHLTARCDSHCKHCYQFDEATYRSEVENELSFSQVISILDDYERTLVQWDADGFLTFSGGDPLLRDDFFQILQHSCQLKRVKEIRILGNPYHITTNMAVKLFQHRVQFYQISIDGMERTHDSLRMPGSFRESVRALKVLKNAGIDTAVMFTLSEENKEELVDVIKYVSEVGVSSFTFARICSVGNAVNQMHHRLSPDEFRQIYLSALKTYDTIMKKNDRIAFPKKDHLWVPLFWELGYLTEKDVREKMLFRCGMGVRHLAILSDGTAMACRRFPSAVGKLPDESIRDVFVHSEFLNKVRDSRNFEKCGRCRFAQICLGCPAVAHGMSGNEFAPDPQCWWNVEEQGKHYAE